MCDTFSETGDRPAAVPPGKLKLIGLGQELRGDDAAGLHALRLLAARYPELDACMVSGEATALLNVIAEAGHAVVLDCVAMPAGSREPVIFDGLSCRLSRDRRSSTHGLSLPDAIELGRILGKLPRRLTVIGIPGHEFDLGQAMSEDTQVALAGLVDVFQAWRDEHA